MDEVSYIVFADQGLVTYRLSLADGSVNEFEDLEEAIRFAGDNGAYEMGVVFPDGDVHVIPLFVRDVFEPGHQNTAGPETKWRHANCQAHGQPLPRRLGSPSQVHHPVPCRQPVRVVRCPERRTPSRHRQPRRAHAGPCVGQGAGELVAAQPGGVVPALPQPVGRGRPTHEPNQATRRQVAAVRAVASSLAANGVDGHGDLSGAHRSGTTDAGGIPVGNTQFGLRIRSLNQPRTAPGRRQPANDTRRNHR